MISFDPQGLALADLLAIARHDTPAQFSAQARQRIDEGHRLLLKLAAEGTPIYGVTTGLGAAVDTPVADRVEDYAGQALAVVDKTRR
ncbi:aromatic amino acid lyase [Pseudomonas sp. HT11]|uniref:aromatic amino acid lyase n=1 Tax=Pseudomonas sp. HT11 TaxID=3230490 RepID=UPI00384B1AC1